MQTFTNSTQKFWASDISLVFVRQAADGFCVRYEYLYLLLLKQIVKLYISSN